MTQGQIHAAFARGEMTAEEAALATQARREYATPLGLRVVFGLAILAAWLLLAWALYKSAPGIR